jgi:hypothetical protein
MTLVSENQREKPVIIKGSVPSSLKLQFKVLCTQKNLKMSEVIGELISQWIQADAPISNFITDETNEDYEDVKGYISNALKTQFKVHCIQKKVKMNFVLYNLINEWIKTEGLSD